MGRRKMLVIVSGPSGSGKSTLIHHVRKTLKGLAFSVSHTTRRRRPSERDGVDYYFVKRNEFDRLAREGEFLEYARVHGSLYGTSWAEVRGKKPGIGLLLDIDVQGAREVKKKIPAAVMVFIMPPVFPELRLRLERRQENSPAAIERRLENARLEIVAYSEFDYVVINDDLARAGEELKSIIIASGCRTDAAGPRIRRILKSFLPGTTRESGQRKRTA